MHTVNFLLRAVCVAVWNSKIHWEAPATSEQNVARHCCIAVPLLHCFRTAASTSLAPATGKSVSSTVTCFYRTVRWWHAKRPRYAC
jgi:hypothetical protein